jgi:hypothetical protein
MRQISSLVGPEASTAALGACVEAGRVAREEACQGLNLHSIVSDSPAASFNLGLPEILPGAVADCGCWCGEDFR